MKQPRPKHNYDFFSAALELDSVVSWSFVWSFVRSPLSATFARSILGVSRAAFSLFFTAADIFLPLNERKKEERTMRGRWGDAINWKIYLKEEPLQLKGFLSIEQLN